MLLHQSDIKYQYQAFLSEMVDLSIVSTILYDGVDKPCEITVTRLAGVYGFTSKEMRDKFVRLCNKQDSETTICFALASVSTDSVEEPAEARAAQKAAKPKRRK